MLISYLHLSNTHNHQTDFFRCNISVKIIIEICEELSTTSGTTPTVPTPGTTTTGTTGSTTTGTTGTTTIGTTTTGSESTTVETTSTEKSTTKYCEEFTPVVTYIE